MQFEQGKDVASSLDHYFPHIQQSYILFALARARRECLLVKRSKEHSLVYFLLETG